ncbi:hypothetical protein KBX50_22065 [Micromonospora sp. C51]|uniref:hypothetical protein n=1 Tax=Micromonospora sp. C51 TaxID=2824879 RepID=UPI001B35A8F4|nr:hypothetical protein [Micromonospora sp. C51]MBQ1051144.1 hypothetical protein [Micromonospora sp. C51]
MAKAAEILAYARKQADELERDMHWITSEHSPSHGYWISSDYQMLTKIVARAAAAQEFLRQYSGAESFWTERAISVYQSKGDNQSTESGARAIGELLRAWADQVEAGVIEIVGSRSWVEVGQASTDVMGQVRRLNEDPEAHPAAAIVLCGAALEVALRAVAESRGIVVEERPTLSVLTKVLRRERLLTVQDVKDLEQCGGLRNLAAHGQFETLSPERAGLMEQQTNLLLRRLSDLVPVTAGTVA